MTDFEASVVLPRPRAEVFEYLRHPANLMKIIPTDSSANLSVKVPEILDQDSLVEFDLKVLGNHLRFVHKITEITPPERITLQQIQGPFKAWTLEQHLAESASGGTVLRTLIRFEPPGGILGFVVTRKVVLSSLSKWVGLGHEAFVKDLSAATS